MRFILGLEQAFRFAPVVGSKRGLFLRAVFLPVKFALPSAI